MKEPTPEGTDHARPDKHNVYAFGEGEGQDDHQSGPDAARTPNLGDLLGAPHAQEEAPDEEAVRRGRTACAPKRVTRQLQPLSRMQPGATELLPGAAVQKELYPHLLLARDVRLAAAARHENQRSPMTSQALPVPENSDSTQTIVVLNLAST